MAVTYTRDGAVAVIEPHRAALGTAAKEGLLAAVERARAEDVRAVLLCGPGCVGQDLKEHARALETDPSTAFDTIDEHYNPLVRALHALPQPVVAAVEGPCAGAGLGLALCADLRVAAVTARFATAFAGIGLAADTGLSLTLSRLAGPSRAAGLLLLGGRFTAEEAAQWGLVHQVVPEGKARAEGLALARRLAGGPTAAYAEIKALLRGDPADLDAALDREAAAQRRLGATSDHREAVRAFLARETPVFKGQSG